MGGEPLVSIIVLNWNGKHFLSACMDALLSQTYPHREIIVVDNASTDGSVRFLQDRYSGRIRLIENERDDGFAGGMNIGMRAACGEFVALVSNDVFVTPRWLEELMAVIRKAPDVGMCAPKILYEADNRVIDKAGNYLYPDGLTAGRGSGEIDEGQYDRVEEVLFPDGSVPFYRKAMLDEIGLFDEQFFMYLEDADLGLRGRLFGWKCLYVPAAVAYHVHSGTVGRSSPLKAMLVERNRFWVAMKLFPPLLLLLLPVFTFARFFWNAYAAMSGRGSAGRFVGERSKGELLLALFKAYASGLKGLPAILKKRRAIRRARKLADGEFMRLIWRFRVSARTLALRDR